jgi:hypothetical protein
MSEVTETSVGKAPEYIAYQVRNRPGKAGIFTRIGAVWKHKDGKGFNVELNAMPLDGMIVIRIASEMQV